LGFGKQGFLPGLVFALLALFAAGAEANILVRAGATADCLGYKLRVRAADLSVGGNYSIDYTFIATVQGVSTPIAGTINFTAITGTITEPGSGSWGLAADATVVTGSATLTSSGSTVPIVINGSTTPGGSAALNCAPGSFSQDGPKLVGAGAINGPGFAVEQGNSVSLSAAGNTAVVGGFGDNAGVGAVWVFTRSGGAWRQQGAKLTGSGSIGPAGQGHSVSLSADGNTALLGGPLDNLSTSGFGAGAAWVFTRAAGIWSEQAKLVGTDASGSSQQGWSVSLSADGNTAIFGGPNDGSSGAAWVFTRAAGAWSQEGAKLVGGGAVGDASQGTAVALSGDGNTALIGGPTDNLASNGHVGAAWVFARAAGVWAQQGGKLAGTGAVGAAFQGAAVALSGDGNTAIVGAPGDGNGVGAAWVFTRSAGVWSQDGAKLVGASSSGPGGQGASVSLSADGNTAIVGGFGDAGGVGAAWVFRRSGGVWSQQGPKLIGIGTIGDALLGASVALSADGNTAFIGGPRDGRNGSARSFNAQATNFSGIPGTTSCYPDSAAALVRRFHGLNAAAASLGYADIPAMQHEVLRFCRG
jgi:hypothetical protein